MKINRRLFIGSLIPTVTLDGCGGASTPDLINQLTDDGISNVLIDKKIVINKELILKNKNLVINPDGGFVIRGGSITLDSSNVNIYFSNGDNSAPNSAFRLISGRFEARNSKFNAYSRNSILDGGYLDQPSPNLIINGINEIEDYELHREIILDSNEFTCHVIRFIGVLSVSNAKETLDTFDDRQICNFSAKNNSFTGFNGVVGVGGLITAEVVGNTANKNTFIQFVLRGGNINFCGNNILSPGNGDPGDGVNILGKIKNCFIINNDIINGSCYGMAIYSDEIENLEIRGNFFLSGATHGLLLTHKNNYNNWLKINISENILTSNVGGFAISGFDCSKVNINNNFFQNNLKGWPSPVLSYNSSIGVFSGNLIFDHLGSILNRESLKALIPLALTCPPIYITGIR